MLGVPLFDADIDVLAAAEPLLLPLREGVCVALELPLPVPVTEDVKVCVRVALAVMLAVNVPL